MARKNHLEFEDGDVSLYTAVTTGRGSDQKTTKVADTPAIKHHPKPGGITDSNAGSHGDAVGFIGLGGHAATEDSPAGI